MPEPAEQTKTPKPANANQEREAHHQENAQAGFPDNREATKRQRGLLTRILYRPPATPLGQIKS